jgi:hypothetical protein
MRVCECMGSPVFGVVTDYGEHEAVVRVLGTRAFCDPSI